MITRILAVALTGLFACTVFANDDVLDDGAAVYEDGVMLADNRRKDRRDDRQDNRDDKQDCRQEEGRLGDDKRECKQQERAEGDDKPEAEAEAQPETNA